MDEHKIRCGVCGGRGSHTGAGHAYVASATPARLDADRQAKPLTKIVAHHRAGDCVLPGKLPLALDLEDQYGNRTPILPKR